MFNIFYNVGRNASHALFDPQPMYCICWNKLLIRMTVDFLTMQAWVLGSQPQ